MAKHFSQCLKYIPNYLLEELWSLPQILYVIQLCILAYCTTTYLLTYFLSYLGIHDPPLIIVKCLLIFKLGQLLGGLFVSRYCKYLYYLPTIKPTQCTKQIYKTAVKLNHFDSIKKLAIIYYLEGKLSKVINIYEQRARGGCMDSLGELSQLYLQDKIPSTNIIKICKILKLYKHDSKIINTVNYHLGIIYWGYDIARSDRYFDKSSQNDGIMGELCGDFYVVYKNFAKAEMMYKRSIKLGNLNAYPKIMSLYDSPLNDGQDIYQHAKVYLDIIKIFGSNPNNIIALSATTKLKFLVASNIDQEFGNF